MEAKNNLDIIAYMNSFSPRTTPNATIRGMLINSQKNNPKSQGKNYSLSDLCNPLRLYFQIKYPKKFQPTLETQKLFALGNMVHGIMGKAIEKMPDFVDTESNLDGNFLGIPVRGRIDAETKDSIFEFKSKGELPKTIEEVFEKYPQDVEQLGFYSFLDPLHRKENYLIFVSQDGKFQLKAFKFVIKSVKGIGNELINRIELLKKVLSGEEPPSVFLKCRHCNKDCILNEEDLCEYINNNSLGCCIKQFVELIPSEEMEGRLSELLEIKGFEDIFSIYNIITSRKTLNESTTDLELEPFEGDELKRRSQVYFEELFYKSDLNISGKSYKEIKENNKIQDIYLKKNNFIKIGDEIYPCLIQASMAVSSSSLKNPHPYKIGELAILSSLTGFNKGYILIYYPNLSDEIRAFEITFEFNKDAMRKIREIVEILRSKDISKINLLPECPDFIHKKNCQFKDTCKI